MTTIADRSFADATPTEVLAALIPEDAVEFAAGWRAVLERAAKTMDLGEVATFMDAWRLVARHTAAHGTEAQRDMYRRAEALLAGDTPGA